MATAVHCTPLLPASTRWRRRRQHHDRCKVHRQVVHYHCFLRLAGTFCTFYRRRMENIPSVYLSHRSILYHLLNNKFLFFLKTSFYARDEKEQKINCWKFVFCPIQLGKCLRDERKCFSGPRDFLCHLMSQTFPEPRTLAINSNFVLLPKVG